MPQSQVSPKNQKNDPGSFPVLLLQIALGVLFFLCLLKFGNPVIMEKYVLWPTNAYEWVLDSWPASIAWTGVFVIGILGILFLGKPAGLSGVLIALPGAWFLWQPRFPVWCRIFRG
jgi:hypothetical protein